MISGFWAVIIFLLFLLIGFYIPGKYFLFRLKLKLSFLETIFAALISGSLLFTLATYLLSWVHLEWLVLPGLLVILILSVKQKALHVPSFESKHRMPLVILIACIIIFAFPQLSLGIFGDRIMYSIDDQWHLSLIREMQVHFPPDVPTAAGVQLRGYHFFYDFLLAKMVSLAHISPFSLHFHLFPLFIASLWALGVYVVLFTWTKKIMTSLIGVFLSMFAGSFAFLYHLLGHKELNLGNGFVIQQPALSLYNPPFSFSIAIVLLALFALLSYLQTRKKGFLGLLVLSGGLVAMFKVYAGITLLSGLGVSVIAEMWKKRFTLLLACLGLGSLLLLTYGILVGNAGSLIYFPLWPAEKLLQGFNWYGYNEKIYTYTHNNVLLGLIKTYSYGLFLFIIGNLGMRIVGFVGLGILGWKEKKMPSVFALSLCAMLLVALALPIFFIQTGKVFEIIQMSMYYLFFSSLFAAVGIGYLFSLKFRFGGIIKSIAVVLFVILTLPSTWYMWYSVVHPQDSKSLSSPYHRALIFLEQRGSYTDTVLELSAYSFRTDDIRRWYDSSTITVPMFANKRSYFASSAQIGVPNNVIDSRIADLSLVLSGQDKSKIENLLHDKQIRYIFSDKERTVLVEIPGIKEIYNDEYVIYEVQSD